MINQIRAEQWLSTTTTCRTGTLGSIGRIGSTSKSAKQDNGLKGKAVFDSSGQTTVGMDPQAAGILKKLAPTISNAVDHRRKNHSLEGLQANVQMLKMYKTKLVIFPRNWPQPRRCKAGICRFCARSRRPRS
ncbi:60S ribosomal protein L13-like isoform X2 [Ananas comosus]|uniref:60S ribosomal protein L13-like isoform X2 n=1 Tax=Ananas comosus TaxID=4615 RepID=A0A6P5H545_ANACO|nr:60S ribosomal protein L13-like isoform X2 [Ananas comosus]